MSLVLQNCVVQNSALRDVKINFKKKRKGVCVAGVEGGLLGKRIVDMLG